MKLPYFLSFLLLFLLSAFAESTEKKPELLSAESVRTEAGREGQPREYTYTFVFDKNFRNKLKVKCLWIRVEDKKIQYIPFSLLKNDKTTNSVRGKGRFTVIAKRKEPTEQDEYKRFYTNILEDIPEKFTGQAGFIFEIMGEELFFEIEKMTKTEVIRKR